MVALRRSDHPGKEWALCCTSPDPRVGTIVGSLWDTLGPDRFGWIFFGHQVGAAFAAYGVGVFRVWFGDYGMTFTTAGLLAVGAAGLALMISQRPSGVPAAVGLPAPTPASR
jgi:hypothetical protein